MKVLDFRLRHAPTWMFLAPFGSRTPHIVLLGMVRGEDAVAQRAFGFHEDDMRPDI